VEAGEQTMGSQLAVLSEAEAALLVARQPSSSPSVTNMVSPSSSQMLENSPALLLQQPPFKLRGINKSLQLLQSSDTTSVLAVKRGSLFFMPPPYFEKE